MVPRKIVIIFPRRVEYFLCAIISRKSGRSRLKKWKPLIIEKKKKKKKNDFEKIAVSPRRKNIGAKLGEEAELDHPRTGHTQGGGACHQRSRGFALLCVRMHERGGRRHAS